MRRAKLGILVLAGGVTLAGCHTVDVSDTATAQTAAQVAEGSLTLEGQDPIPRTSLTPKERKRPTRHASLAWDASAESKRPDTFVRTSLELPRPPDGASEKTSTSERLADEPQRPPADRDCLTPGTLREFESLALLSNPSLGESQARVDALRGKWVQVGLAPNPTAGYAASEVGNEGHSGQQGFYVGQEFVTGGKLRLNRNVTSQEVRRASQRLEAQKQRVLTDVRIGYYDVLVAQRRVELTKELQQTTTRGLEAVNAIVKAQEGSKSDVLQARVEAESASVLVQNAEAAHASAWLQLAAVVGNPEMPQSTVSGDLTSELPHVDFEEARTRLLSASPEMGAASADVNRARWSINQAKAQVIPNVDLQTTRQRDNSTGYWVTGIQATVPVPVLNRNQGGIRQAQAELVAARRAADRVELSLDRRLALTYQQFISSRQRADRYANQILPNIRETLSLVNSGYKAGESSFLQLLTTQRTYVQANLTYLDAVRDTWAAYFEIEGLLLRGSLDQTSTTE